MPRNRATIRLSGLRFSPSGTLLSPTAAFAWLLGSLGVAACIAPWLARGWRWLDLIAATVALVACYDAFALWFARKEFAPVLLSSKKEIRGCEGQSIQIPLALAGSGRRRLSREVRLAIMAATRESETALSVKSGPQRFRLERSELSRGTVGSGKQRARPPLALDAGGRVAAARAVARAARGNRVALALRDLALASVVRFTCAFANRCGFAAWAARNPAQPRLPRAGGRAPSSLDRAWSRIRAPARISSGRQLRGTRVEIHGTARRSGHAPIPVGTEAGSIFRGGPIAGFGVTDRSRIGNRRQHSRRRGRLDGCSTWPSKQRWWARPSR